MTSLAIVGLFSALLVGVECNSRITSAMKKYQIIPEVVSEGAKQELIVGYDDFSVVHLGNKLTPTQTKNKPTYINWDGHDEDFFTLIFTAPDAPSRAHPSFREVIKWLVVNIPGSDISQGETLVEYIGAGPPKDAGIGRYVFFVYKQPGKQKFDKKPIDKYSFEPRKHFSTAKFVRKYNMETIATAVNFFQARYDKQVAVLYKQLNCCMDL